jgi:hypothetical protein
MRKPIATLAATVAAAALPTLIVLALVLGVAWDEIDQDEWWIIMATFFGAALAHALVLGLPAVILLWRKQWYGALPMIVAGLLVGALPYTLFSLPIDDWMDWLQDVTVLGLLGVCGSMAFYGVYRAMHRVEA